MTDGTAGTAGLMRWLRGFDPAAAHLVFAGYATGVMLIAALIGHHLGAVIAGDNFAQSGAIFMAVAAGVPVMIAQPRTGPHRTGDIAALAGAIVGAGLLGAIDARAPLAGQAILIAGAFLAFYVRRWGDPWAKAGLIGLTVLISHQIIGSLTDPRPLDHLVAPAVAVAVLGWWFTPHARFDRALQATVGELMQAIAAELSSPPASPAEASASVARIDARIDRILALRDHADRFDFARAPVHQQRFHTASVAARIWENAADILGGREELRGVSVDQIGSACHAVAAAIGDPSAAARQTARAALAALWTDALQIAGTDAPTTRDGTGVAALRLLALKLALEHLLETAGVASGQDDEVSR